MQHRLRPGIRLSSSSGSHGSEPRTSFPIHIGATGLQGAMSRVFDVHRYPTHFRVDRGRGRDDCFVLDSSSCLC